MLTHLTEGNKVIAKCSIVNNLTVECRSNVISTGLLPKGRHNTSRDLK